MATMSAIRQDELGPPSVLRLASVQRPVPAGTEVLVKVEAAGVNPVDWKTRRDGGRIGPPPFTVGWDVAGTVAELGEGVTRFAVGDRVFGMPRFPFEAAAYAQYVTAPSRQLATVPDAVSLTQAAALPLSSLAAWQALVDTAGVAEGHRVLIQGAAGGVGHLAVQVARSLGAYVIGTASGKSQALLADLGVDEPVDYTRQDVAATVRDVDVVLDLVGGQVAMASLPTLRVGGLLIIIPSAGNVATVRDAAGGRVRVTGMLVEPDRTALEAVAQLAALGKLQARVSRTFPLEGAALAHELGEEGQAEGKMVLLVP